MTTTPTSALAKFTSLAAGLKSQFIDRDQIIEAMLAALASGQHVLLLGEPGTGKSALANALTASIDGASIFGWLMTKASPPEEILGPLSLKGLENDEYRRVTTGKLPEAHVAFIDEIWKSNSTVLNAMLSILNERTFYNGTQAVKVPLLCAVGASNEYPTDSELSALYDRFLLRFWVERLDGDGIIRMLCASEPRGVPGALTLADIEQARREVANVKLGQSGLDCIKAVKAATESAGFYASDRRWRQIARYMRAVAWMSGDAEVTEEHAMSLADVLWREHKERPAVMQAVGKVASPTLTEALEVFDAAKAAMASLPKKGGESGLEYTVRAGKMSAEIRKMGTKLGMLHNAATSAGAKKKIAGWQKSVAEYDRTVTLSALQEAGLGLPEFATASLTTSSATVGSR